MSKGAVDNKGSFEHHHCKIASHLLIVLHPCFGCIKKYKFRIYFQAVNCQNVFERGKAQTKISDIARDETKHNPYRQD